MVELKNTLILGPFRIYQLISTANSALLECNLTELAVLIKGGFKYEDTGGFLLLQKGLLETSLL